MWKIYKITNPINNKSYIGQTCQRVEERWRCHVRDSKKLNTPFARAIQKYGWETFTKEIIDTAKTKEEANEKEKYWIKYYMTSVQEFGKNYGYNITPGGEGTIRITEKEEEEIQKLWKQGYNATQISQKIKRDRHAIGRILKKYYSDEEIYRKQFIKPHKIYVYSLSGKLIAIYNTLPETIKEFSYINSSQIKYVLYHRLASTHNLIFLYEEEIDKLQEHISRSTKSKRQGVKSINLITGEIKIYPTITAAEKDTNICRQTIRNRIRKNIIKDNIKWEDNDIN